MARRLSKELRQKELLRELEMDPLQTDEALAQRFGVSVQTIRLDRLELGLPEMRERARDLAEQAQQIRSMLISDLIGELEHLELGKSARSALTTEPSMGFARNTIVRGHYIFAQANSLAVAVVDAETALTASARLRFVRSVRVGERIVAEANVVSQKGNKHLVRVVSRVRGETVFTGTFIIVARAESDPTGRERA
ncbi:MAG: transcription factor FapR [Firmicutes bacterium]|jgi:acyl-coenzyme A thioesterase PaaI-like protein|nr:transcription factor FapR [Bacillota bacterium]